MGLALPDPGAMGSAGLGSDSRLRNDDRIRIRLLDQRVEWAARTLGTAPLVRLHCRRPSADTGVHLGFSQHVCGRNTSSFPLPPLSPCRAPWSCPLSSPPTA